MYYKRSISLIEVIKSRWGSLVPDDMENDNVKLEEEDQDDYEENDSEDAEEDEEDMKQKRRNKFLPCMFIEGADKIK